MTLLCHRRVRHYYAFISLCEREQWLKTGLTLHFGCEGSRTGCARSGNVVLDLEIFEKMNGEMSLDEEVIGSWRKSYLKWRLRRSHPFSLSLSQSLSYSLSLLFLAVFLSPSLCFSFLSLVLSLTLFHTRTCKRKQKKKKRRRERVHKGMCKSNWKSEIVLRVDNTILRTFEILSQKSLAHNKVLYNIFYLSVCLSVCVSVCLSVYLSLLSACSHSQA